MTNPARSRTAAAPLAVAAAALASGDTADATTLNESTDFGNTFAQSTLLPSGTDVVNGAVFAFEADANDFITFQGLSSGLSFTLDATNSGNDLNVLFFSHLDATGGVIDTQSGTSVQLTGTIPGSGQLNFGISVETGGAFYTLTLVPEPGTGLLLGGGLLAVAALRRARRGT